MPVIALGSISLGCDAVRDWPHIKSINFASVVSCLSISKVSLMEKDTNGSTEAPRSTSSNTQPLSVDSVFDALANRRRRYVLHCLQKYDNPMALADVADEIAVWENETNISEISGEEVKRVYISLYHAHVPKLADAGIVEYNQDRDMVALSENADQVEPFLKSIAE